MQLISLNQNKKHKKDEDETMDTNNFVLDETVIHSFTKFGTTIGKSFSYLLGVIWNYVKKIYSCIVATG